MGFATVEKARLAVADVTKANEVKPRKGETQPPQSATLKTQSSGKIGTAFADAYLILREDNSCSQFFGNSENALQVLGELSARLQEMRLENDAVGIRMSGSYDNIISTQKRFSYRLFETAVVNTRGPFFSLMQRREGRINMVGSFPGASREARALMLLHELGHLIKGADGAWLLPDDARDSRRGHLNTLTIERSCGKLIKELKKTKPNVPPEPLIQAKNQVSNAQPAVHN